MGRARRPRSQTSVRSNTFTMEWPPRWAAEQEFPEIDRAEWFALGEARAKLVTPRSSCSTAWPSVLYQHD